MGRQRQEGPLPTPTTRAAHGCARAAPGAELAPGGQAAVSCAFGLGFAAMEANFHSAQHSKLGVYLSCSPPQPTQKSPTQVLLSHFTDGEAKAQGDSMSRPKAHGQSACWAGIQAQACFIPSKQSPVKQLPFLSSLRQAGPWSKGHSMQAQWLSVSREGRRGEGTRGFTGYPQREPQDRRLRDSDSDDTSPSVLRCPLHQAPFSPRQSSPPTSPTHGCKR